MRGFMIAIAAALSLVGTAADAGVVVTVDKTEQSLTVEVDGATRHQWAVSTGRWGYSTPVGSYRPQRLERQWYSRKYDWSPMPYSIFFNGGYAIHGSYEVSRLGRPASHGCIRLHPNNAATLFELVQRRPSDTRIVVIGGDRPAMVSSRGSNSYSARDSYGRRVIYESYESRPSTRIIDRRGSRTFADIFDDPRRR